MNEFHTADRRLEQFLFAHFIPFKTQTKDVQGYTIWSYADTPRLRDVVAEYQTLIAEQGARTGGKEDFT